MIHLYKLKYKNLGKCPLTVYSQYNATILHDPHVPGIPRPDDTAMSSGASKDQQGWSQCNLVGDTVPEDRTTEKALLDSVEWKMWPATCPFCQI